MLNKNIEYKSKQLLKYYSCNRQKWDDFYFSERWVFERIAREKGNFGDVLDVGCACGGLAVVISEKFAVNSYTGIDINKDVIEWADRNRRKLPVNTNFIAGDILKLRMDDCYDAVVSLSCADWNIQSGQIINACWQKVKPGGYFIISLRLTAEKGINDINKSYQHINFSKEEDEPEIANYAVFNFRDALVMMRRFNPQPDLIGAFGYWGKPSPTAITPFDRLIFAVFYIRKGCQNSVADLCTEFNLPVDIFL